MAKDPAFLFYSDNFLSGTMFFSDEQTGKYIRILCAQHQTGHLREKDMLNICKTYDEDIWAKFSKDGEGKYYNERLEIEINKRKAYSESRSANRKKSDDQHKASKNPKENISSSYDNHMGNGNGNKGKKKVFVPPTLEMVRKYFDENGYSQLGADKAFRHYNEADWHDTNGKPVLSWKQKMSTNWFKEEIKKPELKKSPFVP